MKPTSKLPMGLLPNVPGLKLSAQYKHTVAVTANDYEILTPWHLYLPETA